MQLKSKTSQVNSATGLYIAKTEFSVISVIFCRLSVFSVFSIPTSVSISVFLKTDFSVSVTDPALVSSRGPHSSVNYSPKVRNSPNF
jgi:hypothetical protein